MNDIYPENMNEAFETEESTELINPFDPFENPTENHIYNDDYTKIVPQIQIEGCKIPYIPSEEESKRIRHFYNIAGGGLVLHFILTAVIAFALNFVISIVIMSVNNMSFSEIINEKNNLVSQYIQNSSISVGIAILTYLITNLLVFGFGLKISDIRFRSLFQTTGLSILKIIQYVFIAFFLQYATGMAINLISYLAGDIDVMGGAESFTTYHDIKYASLSVMYTCVVAPITEELFYRGFIMKNFSKVSQRFGIIMSALFFGISHGNIAQFILAFSVGIFMGYINVKHNSVLPSIIVHLAVNILSTSTTIVQNYCADNNIVVTALSIAVYAFAVAGLVMFIIFCKNNIFPKSDIHQQFRCKNIAFKSVGVVAAAIIYTLLMLNTTFR